MRRDEVARRLVLLAALKDKVAQLDRELRDQVGEFKEGDRETAVLNDGPEIGSVTRTRSGTRAVIADEGLWFSWVLLNHPNAIINQVHPAWKKDLLGRVVFQGDQAIDPKTGVVVQGLRAEPTGGGLQVRKVENVAELLGHVDWRLALEAPQGAPENPSCPFSCPMCADLALDAVNLSEGVQPCERCIECNDSLAGVPEWTI
jgi:hypothetical protein